MCERKENAFPCQIRLLAEKDLTETAEVYAEAFNKVDIGEEWTTETAEKFLAHWFEKQPDLFFVAEHEGQIIGGAVAEVKPWWNGSHLADLELFVHPDFQRKSIAKKLIERLITEATTKYGEIAELEGVADGESEFPLGWYERIGVKKTGFVHIAGKPKEILERLE